jgi:purine nucleosidase
MKDITVISDPGVDDMVALVLLDKLANKQRKLLVSTFGNNRADIIAKNAKAFVAFAQDEWEYRPGAALPLNGKVGLPWADYFHGADGLWNVPPPIRIDKCKQGTQAKTSDMFSLGPLTETYKLLLVGCIDRLTIMGGAFTAQGNETNWSEYNVCMDPEAAKLFFKQCRGISVRLVPMDATQKVTWSLEDIRAIPETNETNIWLKQLLTAWFKNYKYAEEKQFVLYDPLAVYLAFAPEAAEWVRSGVDVVCGGKQRGRTVLSKVNPTCEIAMDIKQPQEVSKRIFDLIFESDND